MVIVPRDPERETRAAPDAPAFLVGSGQEPDRNPVVGAQDRVGRQLAPGDDLQSLAVADFFEIPAFAFDANDFRRHAERPHRADISGLALEGVGVGRVAHLEKDRGLPGSYEIFYHDFRRLLVVVPNEGVTQTLDVAVEQHRRHVFDEGRDRLFVGGAAHRCHQHARGLQRLQRIEVVDLVPGAVMRRDQDRAVARVDDQTLDPAGDFGEERVRQVRHHDADVLGQPPVLVHRVDVGPEIVEFERRLDPRPRRFPHTAGIVEIFRHGRPGNPAERGELFHVTDLWRVHRLAFRNAGAVSRWLFSHQSRGTASHATSILFARGKF